MTQTAARTSGKMTTRDIAITAMSLVLVFVFTYAINIRLPIAANGGLVHLGNVPLFVAAILFGKRTGMIAGGVGMALFDLLSGWTLWAPFTLVIKGVEGLLAGYLLTKTTKSVPRILILCLAALVMALGYLAVECVLYTPPVALLSLPGNLMQGAFSVVLAGLLEKTLKKFVSQRMNF
jgi:uncharacterized membrane protein